MDNNGQFKKGHISNKNRLNISGQEFNGIFVMNRVDKPEDRKLVGTYFRCICHCKKVFIAHGRSIKNGWTKSCGCLVKTNHYKSPKGEKNPRWNSNLTEKNRLHIRDDKSRLWASTIKKIHNYTCYKCNLVGVRLVSHHLFSWKQYPEWRYEEWNGVCLCRTCHYRFHKNYGLKGFTMSDFEDFLLE
jgi:hypothetical protein